MTTLSELQIHRVQVESGVRRLQAVFRGRKSREIHVQRVKKGLPWSPFVPAQYEAIDAMLSLAKLQPGEVLVDIGSGDGRVLWEAMRQTPKLGKALGIELDGALVHQCRRQIAAQGLEECVEIVHGDWLEADLWCADVVVLFFLPHEAMGSLLAQKLRPGTRVVTYVFEIKPWKALQVVETVPFMTQKGSSKIFLYQSP